MMMMKVVKLQYPRRTNNSCVESTTKLQIAKMCRAAAGEQFMSRSN